MPHQIHVFAYGSNMSLRRISPRTPSARVVTVGYVRGRRLAFHKIGRDGSGKADAVRTDCDLDRLWGVLFAIRRAEKSILDAFEHRYTQATVDMIGKNGVRPASIYVATPAAIDASLKPFSWYHQFVRHGAVEHGLPAEYVRQLDAVPFMVDPDGYRHRRNSMLLVTPPDSRHHPSQVGSARKQAVP